jgi:aryl-alcohol dehydrogenase-like predicted oxidoreductase
MKQVTLNNGVEMPISASQSKHSSSCKKTWFRSRPGDPLPKAEATRHEPDPIAKLKYDATVEADKMVVDRVVEAAEKFGVPPAQIALAWLLQSEPVVAPVIGATKLPHLESAVEALSVQLASEDVAYLEEPYVPHPVVGLIPYSGQW